MAYTHGVYKREVATSLIAPVTGASGLPVVIGTAPIFMGDIKNVNAPKLCYTYAEAVENFGYSSDWENYTLCEFIYSQFALYGQAPVVLINVFDPEKHSEIIEDKEFSVNDGVVNLGKNIIKDKGVALDLVGAKFTLAYDDEENLILTFDGAINAAKVKATFYQAKPGLVSANDIVGGYDVNTGKYKGLELVGQIYPKFRLIPGIIAGPKFSQNAGVAAVMRAKCEDINGLFSCVSVVDIPSDEANAMIYTEAPEWKNKNNYVGSRQIVCWPKVKLDDKIFHLSTQLIGVMNQTDNNNGDVPYVAPSNQVLQIDGCVNGEGEEVNLGFDQANYLNSQGIVTALNAMNGWVSWGIRTACYPGNSDPKDCQISIRRMFDYVGNTFITTFWQRVDAPITRRLIQTITNTFNVYLNGLAAREMILGGRIEFTDNENTTTSLMDGKLAFHVYMTPPSAAETIEGIFEYDPDYLSQLFS